MATSAERMRRLRERRAAEGGPPPAVRDAGELLGPAVVALGDGCPAADRPLLLLAVRMARVIDAMGDELAATMLPNHAGPLVKVLDLLERNARARRAAEERRARPNRVRELAKAHQKANQRRRG